MEYISNKIIDLDDNLCFYYEDKNEYIFLTKEYGIDIKFNDNENMTELYIDDYGKNEYVKEKKYYKNDADTFIWKNGNNRILYSSCIYTENRVQSSEPPIADYSWSKELSLKSGEEIKSEFDNSFYYMIEKIRGRKPTGRKPTGDSSSIISIMLIIELAILFILL